MKPRRPDAPPTPDPPQNACAGAPQDLWVACRHVLEGQATRWEIPEPGLCLCHDCLASQDPETIIDNLQSACPACLEPIIGPIAPETQRRARRTNYETLRHLHPSFATMTYDEFERIDPPTAHALLRPRTRAGH